MAYDFNADNIFEIAEQIERNGAVFYRNAAENVSEPESKKLLLDLAAMEDEHEKTFSTIRKTLSDKEKVETAFDPLGESVQYLKALADTRVFFKKGPLGATATLEEILKSAIGAEKDSIVFYLGMKDAVPENTGKNRIDSIIKEEMKHVKILSQELIAQKK